MMFFRFIDKIMLLHCFLLINHHLKDEKNEEQKAIFATAFASLSLINIHGIF